jgi:hypothetical protein
MSRRGRCIWINVVGLTVPNLFSSFYQVVRFSRYLMASSLAALNPAALISPTFLAQQFLEETNA